MSSNSSTSCNQNLSYFLAYVSEVLSLSCRDFKEAVLFATKETAKANEADEGELECCVCLSQLVEGKGTRKLPCLHMFHTDCVDRWLDFCTRTCPLCRLSVDCDPIWRADMELTEELGIWFSSFHLPGF